MTSKCWPARAEPALYAIDRDLRDTWPSLSIVPVVGDVGDRERMLAVLREHRPQVVVHAAAHKHVPLMETNVPGANGQGRTKQGALDSLAAAIELILEDRREDGLRGMPPDAVRETVTIA